MQRRHFELIAAALKDMTPYARTMAEWAFLQQTACRFADRLALTNHLFKRDKFMRACGLDSPPEFKS